MGKLWRKWTTFRDSHKSIDTLFVVITELLWLTAIVSISWAGGMKDGARDIYDMTLPSVVDYINDNCPNTNLYYDTTTHALYEKLGEKAIDKYAIENYYFEANYTKREKAFT